MKNIFITLGLLLLTGCSLVEYTLLNKMDTTHFQVRGQQLFMDGLINTNTPDQLEEILKNNPALKEVVMLDVPGSVDDEANLVAARMIRQNGLNTRLLGNSEVASGGTDFFASGVERRAAAGARFGVHSWADVDGTNGNQVSKDHAQHQLYLNYYAEMGIPEEFYWYTLGAATAQDIHWMSDGELEKYKIVTH